MKKILARFKVLTVILIILELGSLIAFGIIYFFNKSFLEQVTRELVFIVAVGLIVIDLAYLWIAILVFSRAKKKTDLKAADLIGGDIQDAYNFGMLGLIVTDENNNVLWVNEFLRERRIDILDTNIIEWQPKLAELQNGPIDRVVKLVINSRNYDAKFLQNAGLYILKDTTDLESITDAHERKSPVIGIILIDNFSDISGSTVEDANDTITKVRNAIFDYCNDYDVLLRRYKNDAYLIITTNENLKKMEEDKFSLLEKVHIIGEKEDTPPTLSIGIAYDTHDIVKLNSMATSAIEMAMSRGGDQVVVSRYNSENTYYGGKSEAQENRNKVKVRVNADTIITLIKNSSNVLIMGHTMMDMDSLGSALGIKAICDTYGMTSHIVYDPKLTERKTRGAITSAFSRDEVQKITISPNDALGVVRTSTLIILVDVHRPSLTICPKLIEKGTKVLIIDHHRRSEEYPDDPVFACIDPSASSASELVAEFIHYGSSNPKVMIPSSFATIMLSGIFMDTNFFKSKACGIRTFEASMYLKQFGADNSVADDYLKDEFEEYTLITRIISTLKTPHYGIVYCAYDEDTLEQATIAKVANQCMQMRGVNACFVIGKTGLSEVKMSCRSDGTINVQLLAEKLNGGGHFTQAACVFKGLSVDRVESKLLDVLNEYLNDARSAQEG